MRAYLLYEHLKPETHPFEPENILIFMTGPLTRTTFPSVSKLYVMPPFPPPGTFLDSYPGGFFGTSLKWTGYDTLEIGGSIGLSKSER